MLIIVVDPDFNHSTHELAFRHVQMKYYSVENEAVVVPEFLFLSCSIGSEKALGDFVVPSIKVNTFLNGSSFRWRILSIVNNFRRSLFSKLAIKPAFAPVLMLVLLTSTASTESKLSNWFKNSCLFCQNLCAATNLRNSFVSKILLSSFPRFDWKLRSVHFQLILKSFPDTSALTKFVLSTFLSTPIQFIKILFPS